MNRDSIVSNVEKNFLLAALREGRRLDGRGEFEMRKLCVTYGRGLGHAEVVLGATRCVATVSAEICVPREEAPNEGVLIFSTTFTPMCSPDVEPGRISEDEIYVSRMLDKSLRRNRAIDTEGLCILGKQKVWMLRIDVCVLDHDGNVMDCASAAVVAALMHFRRPDVTVKGEEVIVHDMDEKAPVPIKLNHAPLCCSFGFFEDGAKTVLDPSQLEEKLQQGKLTVATNVHRELCALSMSGGSPLDVMAVMRCTQLATANAVEKMDVIKSALTVDLKKRGMSLHTSDIFKKLIITE